MALSPLVPMSAATFEKRAYYGALFEPVDTVLTGGGQDTGTAVSEPGKSLPDGYVEMGEALGEDFYPVTWMTYVGLDRSAERIVDWGHHVKRTLDAIGRSDVMPQVGLNMTRGNDQGEGLDRLIARGEFDDRIEALCEALAIIDRPTFVRIGYEFEGSWNGYDSEAFKECWIRITKAMRQRRLNVATVWCSAGGSAGPVPLADVLKFYPGDRWVDWWGVDVFSPEEIGTEKLKEFCVVAGERGFPVMLGEVTPRYVGVLDGKKDWEKWFDPFFSFVRERPEVKSICYINWDWDFWAETLGFGWVDWQDSRIQKNKYVLRKFREEMDLPLYEHAK